MAKLLNRYSLITLILGIMASFTITPARAAGTYDYAWLVKVAAQDDAIDKINAAWGTRTGDMWRAGEAGAGTYDIPANSVIIGSKVGGNDPAFVSLAPNIWYTPEGGRFSTNEGYRSFQLDGAVHAKPTAERPQNASEMITLLSTHDSYGAKINALDVEWTGSPIVINRWGSSGWQELLTAEQQDLLKNSGQRPNPLKQLLPGDTIVWGELKTGCHWGLRKVSENIYATTGNGGMFCTDRGFRAMQFPKPATK